jgi:hypothetical protein
LCWGGGVAAPCQFSGGVHFTCGVSLERNSKVWVCFVLDFNLA